MICLYAIAQRHKHLREIRGTCKLWTDMMSCGERLFGQAGQPHKAVVCGVYVPSPVCADYDHEDGEDTDDDEEDTSYRFYGQMGVGRGRHTRRASVADDDDDDSAFYPQGLNTGCGFDDDSDTAGATSQAGSAWAVAPSVGDSVMSVGDKTQQASKALGLPGVAVREVQLQDQGPNAAAQQALPAGAPARVAPPAAAAGASATVSTFSVATAEAGATTGAGADGSCASPKGLPPVPDRRALTTQPTMARRIQVRPLSGKAHPPLPSRSNVMSGIQLASIFTNTPASITACQRHPCSRLQQNVKRKLESLVNSGGGTVIARLRLPGRLFLPAGVDGALVSMAGVLLSCTRHGLWVLMRV